MLGFYELAPLIEHVHRCMDYRTLYALEEEFNKVGLTVQSTPQNHMILCKIMEGKPHAEKVIRDYIFVGSLEEKGKELSDRAVKCITTFIKSASTGPAKVLDAPRVWRDGLRLYGDAVRINSEDSAMVAQLL